MDQPPVTSRRLRILLVEDHATVREGLKLLIDKEHDMEVVAEASDGEQAVQRAQLHNPDVVVMDMSMPRSSGLVATRTLKELLPSLQIVSLTRYADESYVQEALRAGVSGYVLKQSGHQDLLHAIRTAARGGQYIDSSLTPRLTAAFVEADRKKAQRGVPPITERETTVLRLSARGHTNTDIARQLQVSVKTIEVHKANAMRKLGLSGRIELLRFAQLQGWLDPS